MAKERKLPPSAVMEFRHAFSDGACHHTRDDGTRCPAPPGDAGICWTALDDETALAQLLEDGVLFANSRQYAELRWIKRPGMTPPAGGIPAGEMNKYYNVVPGDLQPETIVLFVNCNDVFYWGCADAEPLPLSELRRLYEMWRESPAGPTRWCCLRRGMRPQHPVMDDMRKAGTWTADLEALPPRSAADACLSGCCASDTTPRL